MGADPWQTDRIADAFAAAEAFNADSSSNDTGCYSAGAVADADHNDATFIEDGVMNSYTSSFVQGDCDDTATQFKLAISLDMSSFTCANSGDIANLRSIITAHSNSPAQLTMCTPQGVAPVLSTFAGEYCGFGQGGWASVSSGFWFAPAWFDMSVGWTSWSGVQASMNVSIFFDLFPGRPFSVNALIDDTVERGVASKRYGHFVYERPDVDQ